MFRKLVVLPVLLAALVFAGAAACGGKEKNAVSAGASATPNATTSDGCPTSATKKFAKTRFAADAAIAFGAFHRYIWKPYKAQAFKTGDKINKGAVVKAGVAAAVAVNRLNAARKLVTADPSLCKALKQPVDKLSASLSGLVNKLKSGDFNPSEIDSVSSAIDSVKSEAADKTGTSIK
jgi:hypothetical protein